MASRPRCGARFQGTRLVCRNAPALGDDGLPRNGRCELHGGLSSGPKSTEGRARVGAAVRRRHQNERLVRRLAEGLLNAMNTPGGTPGQGEHAWL